MLSLKSILLRIRQQKALYPVGIEQFLLDECYIANKKPDSYWGIISKTNLSAYFDSATYIEIYENKIIDGFMEKKPEMGGVSVVRLNL